MLWHLPPQPLNWKLSWNNNNSAYRCQESKACSRHCYEPSPFQDVLWKCPGSFHGGAITVPSELRDRTGCQFSLSPKTTFIIVTWVPMVRQMARCSAFGLERLEETEHISLRRGHGGGGRQTLLAGVCVRASILEVNLAIKIHVG